MLTAEAAAVRDAVINMDVQVSPMEMDLVMWVDIQEMWLPHVVALFFFLFWRSCYTDFFFMLGQISFLKSCVRVFFLCTLANTCSFAFCLFICLFVC